MQSAASEFSCYYSARCRQPITRIIVAMWPGGMRLEFFTCARHHEDMLALVHNYEVEGQPPYELWYGSAMPL